MYRRISGNAWWRESLLNLANHQQFAKLKPSQLVFTVNNLLVNLFICQAFYAKIFIYLLLPNIIATKLPHNTVYYTHIYKHFNALIISYYKTMLARAAGLQAICIINNQYSYICTLNTSTHTC